MGGEQSSKRPHYQIDADNEAGESSPQSSESSHYHSGTENEAEDFPGVNGQRAYESTNAESEVGGSSKQAASRSQDKADDESETTEPSKRPCLEERRLLGARGLDHTQHKASAYATTYPSPTREPTSSNYGDGPSAPKTICSPSLDYNSRLLREYQLRFARLQKHSPSGPIPPSLLHSLHGSKPNPTRPTFNQLATDGQQGMKVLFLVDHATKGDAIHHNLKPFFPSPSSSSELKLLMSKYRSDRSNFQNRYFAKARTICAQLTSRREFAELKMDMGESGSSRASRLAYFSEKCSKVHLATLYSHLASAVDIAKILLAQTPNDRAFKNLMTQVFIHSMEDLWCFELHPSKQDLPAKREKENKEDVYNRFRVLTDREHGLPAAQDLPGYLEVPLKAKFPKYVLFGQVARPRNEEDVYESDEVGDDDNKGGDIPHPWIPAEVRSRHNEFASKLH